MSESVLSRGNLFASLPIDRNVEHFDTLTQLGDIKLQRIVSFGQRSADACWYDQEHSEWVIVLRGQAKLEIDGHPQPIALGPGDYVDLPAHTRHRVAWTAPEEATIWLAIHY